MTAKPQYFSITYQDPVRAYAALATGSGSAFLDSAKVINGRGRYSYIAADPFRVLSLKGAPSLNLFDALAAELNVCRLQSDPAYPPFQCGAIGFIGYEAGACLERLPLAKGAGTSLPDLYFGFYDTVVAFDNHARKAWIIAADLSVRNISGRPRPSVNERVAAFKRRLDTFGELPKLRDFATCTWRAEMTREDYLKKIQRTIDYIYDGDIFQANITHRFLARRPPDLDPFSLYRSLRALSPNPYNAFLDCGSNTAIASASPEMFLRLSPEGEVITRPIKGTRPRGNVADKDRALAAELLASTKDRAENLMIVDLMRNDIGKVSRIGSVKVTELFKLETFSNIHHLVSEIRSQLVPGLGPVDLLRATFPGGSVTGAPKVRAMEIIHELEPARRGPYCGTVASIGFDGSMESSIIIRTLVVNGDEIVAQAGGGIIADSHPEREYEELLDKAGPMLSTLNLAWREALFCKNPD